MSGTAPGALSETVSPVKVTLPAGQLSQSEQITVTNTGSAAITVHAAGGVLSSSCKVGSAPGWVTVTPASKILQPGHSEHARLVVHAPAGTTGTTDVAALFTATGHARGNAQVSGTVASQVVVHSAAGTPVTCGSHREAAAAPSGDGIPAIALGITALLFVVLIAAVWMRLRRRGTHRVA